MSHKKLSPFIVKVSVLGYFPLQKSSSAMLFSVDSIGRVSILEFEFLSGRMEVFKCTRSVKYVRVFFCKER